MQIKKYLVLLCAVTILVVGVFGLFYKNNLKEVQAGAGDNVWGFAWSDLMGWVSFNSINCDANNDGLSDGAPVGCPAAGTSIPSYGVRITDQGATGLFSGYAWSSNAGWLLFNSTDWFGACPLAPAPCPQATVDKATGDVSGWAQLQTTRDWVRFRRNDFVVYNVSINRITGDFFGMGWGGETIGWLSFNSVNYSGPFPYKVQTSFPFIVNNNPTVVVSPNPSAINLCTSPGYSFAWTFSDPDVGDTQSAYRIQIVKVGEDGWVATGPDEVDFTVPTPFHSQTKEIQLSLNPSIGVDLDHADLSYGTTYQWRVMVWDNGGLASAWGSGNNFTTPTHISPTPDFTWSPQIPIKDQAVQFTDNSICYGPSYPSCAGANFLWTLPPGAVFDDGFNATSKNPIIKFGDSGRNQPVLLQITDLVGTCSASKNVNVALPLPKYKELPPE